MSNPSYDYDPDSHSLIDGYEPEVPNEERDDYLTRVRRSDIRKLEEANKVNREKAQKAEKLEREIAMLRAGIDLDSDKGAFFAKGYEGDLDPAKIREAAETLGILGSTDDNPGEDANPNDGDVQLEEGEAELEQERQRLESGSPSDEMPNPDPYKAMTEVHERIRNQGGLERQALGGAFNSLVNAAHQGDDRVIIEGRSPQAEG